MRAVRLADHANGVIPCLFEQAGAFVEQLLPAKFLSVVCHAAGSSHVASMPDANDWSMI